MHDFHVHSYWKMSHCFCLYLSFKNSYLGPARPLQPKTKQSPIFEHGETELLAPTSFLSVRLTYPIELYTQCFQLTRLLRCSSVTHQASNSGRHSSVNAQYMLHPVGGTTSDLFHCFRLLHTTLCITWQPSHHVAPPVRVTVETWALAWCVCRRTAGTQLCFPCHPASGDTVTQLVTQHAKHAYRTVAPHGG